MYVICLFFIGFVGLTSSAFSQGKPQSRPPASRLSDLTSDEKAAEIKRLIEIAQVRQKAADERNTRIWRRWDYAVCIGCGPVPKGMRLVYTTPARVLAGVIAADDDARNVARKL